MKKLIATYCLLFTSIIVIAQSPKWAWAKADTAAKVSSNPAHALAATHGKVLWGELNNKKMIYGPSVLGGYTLSEYDSAGHFLDSTSITGKFTLLDAHADNAGNWYVLGQYFDTVNFPSGLQYVRDPFAFPTGSDYFIFRLNSGSLSLAWTKHIGTNTYTTASAFTIANNSLYIVIDSVTTYICKYDLSTGNRTTLWPQTGMSRVSSIAADEMGNIYLAGSCSHDTISFNGHIESVPYFYNSYIMRYKSTGAFDWIQWMDDVTCTPRTVSLVTNNFIYYSGQMNDSLIIGSFHLGNPAVLSFGYMAARLDSTGHVYWARAQRDTTTGGTTVTNVYTASVTADSCLQLSLTVRGTVNFGNGLHTSAPPSKTLATIVCINPDSTTKWLKSISGINTTTGHIISTGRDLYVTGNGSDSTALQFDSLATPVTVGANTPYIAKLNVLTTPVDTNHNTVVPTINEAVLTIAPNPATKEVSILGMEKINGNISVAIVDIFGRTVFLKNFDHASGKEEINVANYPRGLYFIEIKADGYTANKKLVLQ